MMPYYLIYQDSSADEGSRTAIVGPFVRPEDREVIRRSHELNAGGGWANGPYDYEYVGEIDGEVRGFTVEGPDILLDRYPDGEEAIGKVRACAALLVEKGFPEPEWLANLKPPTPRHGFQVDAAAALKVWARQAIRDQQTAASWLLK